MNAIVFPILGSNVEPVTFNHLGYNVTVSLRKENVTIDTEEEYSFLIEVADTPFENPWYVDHLTEAECHEYFDLTWEYILGSGPSKRFHELVELILDRWMAANNLTTKDAT